MIPQGERNLPGETGLWIFLFADLLLFSLFFGLAGWDIRLGEGGQAELDTTIGMLNTIVLLTGSWAVVMGTRVVENARTASRYILGAASSGGIFLALKIAEYSHHIGAGHSISEAGFWNWYFFLTGYHALHVVLGIVLLAVLGFSYRGGSSPDHRFVEAVGCYWHLVDLLWIGIFLVLYLL